MSKRKKGKEGENSSRNKFKSICVFSELEIGKSGDFLIATGDLGNALAVRMINLVYGGGI